LAETQQVIADYAAKAEPFVKLQTAINLSRLVETLGASKVQDELLNVFSNAADAGGEGFIAGLPFLKPLSSAASSAFVSGLVTAAARIAVSEEDLGELPKMLEERPEEAIALVDKLGLALEFVEHSGLAGGVGKALYRGAREGAKGFADVATSIAAEEAVHRMRE
jgi:hypothetical protein